jgi:hypothetical protein
LLPSSRACPVSGWQRLWDSPFGASLLSKGIHVFPRESTRVSFLPHVPTPFEVWRIAGRDFRDFTLSRVHRPPIRI